MHVVVELRLSFYDSCLQIGFICWISECGVIWLSFAGLCIDMDGDRSVICLHLRYW